MRDRALAADLEQELRRRCEHALFAAVRASGAASRQQLRAAARGFVRRHRRDRAYLSFVLRGVLANSALAAVLLGLAPSAGRADPAVFTPVAFSSLISQDVGTYATPALGDLDGDGDLDLVSGNVNGVFRYYENTGTATAGLFVLRTLAANPLAGKDVGFDSAPALGDLDGDGDLDLVSGESAGGFAYVENVGSATVPAFELRTGSANPLDGESLLGLGLGYDSKPAFADLDRDGDLDLVVGGNYGGFAYFENTGSRTTPAFVARTIGDNPLGALDVGYAATPALGDFDLDGDLDLVAGERYASFVYYENTGSAAQPAFTPSTAPPALPPNASYSAPTVGDLDGDGDPDFIWGNADGRFGYYENITRVESEPPPPLDPLAGQDVGSYARPSLGDLDGDGDLDLVSGAQSGTFSYFENTGSVLVPAFAARTGSANPFPGVGIGGWSAPALGDLDDDGDLDVLSGGFDGAFHYYENTGSAATPAFVLRTGSANPLNSQPVGTKNTPALGDLDGDGDLDLLVGQQSGVFSYFENTGNASAAAFVPRTGSANPLDGQDLGDRSVPALADVDGDDDLDLAAGSSTGGKYYENIGTLAVPAFVVRTGSANPFQGTTLSGTALGDLDADHDGDLISGGDGGGFVFKENLDPSFSVSFAHFFGPIAAPFSGVDVGSFSAPAAQDLDGDGDPDFTAADAATGAIHFFENTGSVLVPAVVELTGAENPFDGLNAGGAPRLALADLDADGDLDLVSGESGGNPLHYFENTGSATTPAFVARTGGANPFAAVIHASSAPALGDFDTDGDLDLVVGEASGAFHYYENTGSAENPLLIERTGSANPLNGLGSGVDATPAFADLERDGDLDLIAGVGNGQFQFFENTGTATTPAYVARIGLASPLAGEDAGLDSSPALVDLDADGDPDLVSGDSGGALVTYYLPEPSRALGIGAALLAWLARRRRGS